MESAFQKKDEVFELGTIGRFAVFASVQSGSIGLGFAIPYVHNGEDHDYVPDFIVRLAGPERLHLVLETKGYDPLKEVKAAAAERWVQAVHAEGTKGRWAYTMVAHPTEVPAAIERVAQFSDERSHAVRIQVCPGEVKVHSSISETGESRTCKCSWSIPETKSFRRLVQNYVSSPSR